MFTPIILPIDQAVSAVASAEWLAQAGVASEQARALTQVHLFAVGRNAGGMLTMGHSSHASHASHASSSGGGIGWPEPIVTRPVVSAPSTPSAPGAVAGDGIADVSWAAPASDGGDSAITYTVTAYPSGATLVVSGATSVRFEGLQDGTAYSFTVIATNSAGQSPVSPSSGTVVPLAPQLERHVPVIVGKPIVGRTLRVAAEDWPAGTTLSYQWRASGRDVAGATGRTFRPTRALVGKRVSVTVSAVNPAYARGSVSTSAKTKKVARAGRPKIEGSAVVGSILVAETGTWTKKTAFRITWLVGGKPVKASGTALTVQPSYAGKTIAARVTGKREGYTTVVVTSAAKKVHR